MYVPPAFRIEDLPAIHAAMGAVRLASLVDRGAGRIDGDAVAAVARAGGGGARDALRARGAGEPAVAGAGAGAGDLPGAGRLCHAVLVRDEAGDGEGGADLELLAVHASGPVEFFDDPERLRAVVTRLTERHEAGRAEPWAVGDAPEAFVASQLKGIVGLRLPIARLEGKAKMSQNRPAADRAGVAEGLAASERATDRAVARMIPQG